MHHVFHYHVLYVASQAAGFSAGEALELAQASAMVDQAIIPWTLQSAGMRYTLPCTHHYGFSGHKTPWETWVPFHFLPGEVSITASTRKSGRSTKYTVSPGSALSEQQLNLALHTRDLMRIGIALHAYSDSFAHQNFSGIEEADNAIGMHVLLPPIGHAKIGNLPDIPGKAWIDTRLINPLVENNRRFMAALELQYHKLCRFTKKPALDWKVLQDNLSPLFPVHMQQEDGDKISAAIHLQPQAFPVQNWKTGPDAKEIIASLTKRYNIPPYQPDAWLLDTIEAESKETIKVSAGKIIPKLVSIGTSWLGIGQLPATGGPLLLRAKPGYTDSQLARWSIAAIEHRKVVSQLLAEQSVFPAT